MTVEDLREVCDEIVHDPSLEPVRDAAGRIVETHCNEGAERVAQRAGCRELDGLMADQQYAVMDEDASGLWERVTDKQATAHAMAGGLAFAAATSAMLGELHGHIAAVCPEPMEYSPSLGRDVPMVANVGKTDQEERESCAFPVAMGEPDFFAWRG